MSIIIIICFTNVQCLFDSYGCSDDKLQKVLSPTFRNVYLFTKKVNSNPHQTGKIQTSPEQRLHLMSQNYGNNDAEQLTNLYKV